VYDGVPAVPPALAERLKRYGNARSAAFADWLPDGTMLIATRFGSTPQLHHLTAPGAARRQITFFDEPVTGAQARPKGSGEFVFARDRGGDEYYQGYVTRLAGFETPFTEPKTRNQAFTWSRDGALLAWARVTPGDPNYDVMLMKAGASSSRRVVLEGSGAISPIDVANDGRTMLLGRVISAAERELYRVDVTTGRLTEINPSDEKIAYGAAQLTPDGRTLYVASDEGSDFKRLTAIDLASGRKTVVTPDLNWDVEGVELSDDGALLAYSVNEDGLSRVVLQNLRTRRALPAPKLPPAVVGGLEFSPDGRRLAMTLATNTGTDVYTWELGEQRLTRWTDSELGGLDPNLLAPTRVIRFKSFDGRSIPALVERLAKPAQARSPVIINIHGGPEGQERPGFSPAMMAYMTELGAVVISPNVRGSEGYGKIYLSLDNADKREDSVKDIGALLDWIRSQPDLDPERVVVTGGSYGGYMVLASLVHYSDRLAGGIDVVGISNFITFLNNTEGYRRDLRRVEYGDERDPAMRAVFERISPLNNAERIRKPLLVVQGDNDPRVPKSEADQLVQKLRRQGTEVWYLRARNEGHGFRKKENRDAQREVEMMYLRKILRLPEPAPVGTPTQP
jgi:dipeptidyl aminopeptidase/acylaminoacyl peptidase